MANRQERKGQRFKKKKHVRKITHDEEKYFQLSFKGVIRFDLAWNIMKYMAGLF